MFCKRGKLVDEISRYVVEGARILASYEAMPEFKDRRSRNCRYVKKNFSNKWKSPRCICVRGIFLFNQSHQIIIRDIVYFSFNHHARFQLHTVFRCADVGNAVHFRGLKPNSSRLNQSGPFIIGFFGPAPELSPLLFLRGFRG